MLPFVTAFDCSFRARARRKSSFIKLLTILCLFGITPAALSESGTLEIYPMATQNGTSARRVFTDEHNRPTREIYYRAKSFTKNPEAESDLDAYLVRLYSYDRDGRNEWMGEYSPELILQRSLETLYNPAGQLTTRQWRDSDGIIRYQTRYPGGREASHLYFDDTGTRLVSIRGEIPSDIELASGWGKKVDGLACGIGFNRDKGKLEDFRFDVTIRNFTASPLKAVTCLRYQEIKVELLTASGQIVPQDTGYIRQRDKRLREMNHGTNENVQTIPPNESQTFNGSYELKEWYRNVPDGKYTLTVRRRADGPEFSLPSRPVEIEVLSEEAH